MSGICDKTDVYSSGKIPVIHIPAENLKPLDMGLEIGQQSKRLFTDIEYRYDRYLMGVFSQMGFDDILRNRLPKLKANIANKYQKELEGVASSWTLIHDNKLGDGSLSWDEFWVLNLLADIGIPANGTGFGVLSAVSKEQGAIVGRNLDLKSTPELRSLQAITVYQYADHAVVNIGFAGVISVLTGFNERGLFVAHYNAASDSSYQNSYLLKETATKDLQAYGFALRDTLETMKTARKAASALAKNAYGISSNTLIADKTEVRVLEYSPSGKAQIRNWNSATRTDKRWSSQSQIAVVDCHVLSGMSANCQRAKDTYRWDYLRTLAVFTEDKKAGVQDIAKIMLDSHNQYYEILGSDTLQSMIYLPATGHLYLYAAPMNNTNTPAAYKVYYRDLLPADLRDLQHKTNFFWWIAGLLVLLAIALWLIRRSMREKPSARGEVVSPTSASKI